MGLWKGQRFVLHASFPARFRWRETLPPFDRNRWAIYRSRHLVTLLVRAFTSYVSIRHPRDLLLSPLGGPLLVTFALVPIIRIVTEFLYFGFDGAQSLIIIATSLITAAVYLLAFTIHIRPADGGL